MKLYFLESIINLGLGFLVTYVYKADPSIAFGLITVIILQEFTRDRKH